MVRRHVKRGVGLVSGVVAKVRNVLRQVPPETLKDIGTIAKVALGVARRSVHGAGGRIRIPKVLSVPKRGGFPPLLPITAALGGVCFLAGGVSSVIRAIQDIKSGRALKRGGLAKGVLFKPYKKGYGISLDPYNGPYAYSGR